MLSIVSLRGGALGRWFFARCDRLIMLFFAGVVVIEERARFASDLHAALAIGLVAVVTNQGTYPRGLAAHCVERIKACDLHVELHTGILVE